MVRGIRHRHRRRLPQFPLGKVSGWRRTSPLSSQLSQKRAFVSRHGVGSAGLARSSFWIGELRPRGVGPSKWSMSSSENASRSTSSVTEAFHRSRGGAGAGVAVRHPCDRRSATRFGRWCERASDWSAASHADGRFERVLDFDAHQRIQSEIGERLVVAQTVWLDAQDGADDLAHRRGDDRSPALPARRIRS